MQSNLPVIGAAMTSNYLEKYHSWIISNQRDLELQDLCITDVLDVNYKPLAHKINGILDGFSGRLGIHGPFLSLSLWGFDSKIRAIVIERMKYALDFCAEIGATHMVIHSPFFFFGNPFMVHTKEDLEQAELTLLHSVLDPIVEYAKQAQCTLVIENISDSNPFPLLKLIESFQSHFVKCSLDTGHAFMAQRFGGPAPDQWIRETASYLAHVHLQDTDGLADRHWAVGRGNINWFSVFHELSLLASQPRLIIEVRDLHSILESANWLISKELAR